jgi:class 3 adenylate cyclase
VLTEAPPTPGREERKVVTVLFADLVGFTARAEQMDPEDVAAVLAPYHARLRSELERRGGTVEKFIGDAVMAIFGAPVAHEDDPERAVRAAVAIRDWVLEAGDLEVRIGVNTGEALVTLGARPVEGEGMAAGDVVNTAARLQASAPVNGVLVGETTYRATDRAIEYRDAPPVQAKGKAEPVPVWEAVAARSRFGEDVPVHARTPLVGRQRELDVLADALARVRQKLEPQLVTLVGVPGIGKSRLVLELFRLVDADPELIWWRQGRSLPYGEGVTYWALGEIAKAQAGILETDPAEDVAEKLARAVADLVAEAAEAQWIESHLRPLVGLGGELAAGDDPRSEAFAAWRRFFEALAERNPLVLVFEDLQWADDGLLDFVDYLVDWATGVPLLAVCSARPELLERRPGWAGGKRNATTVSLSPLSPEDTARLIAGLLEQAVLPAEEQTALLDRAEGNPLYAEEYARLFLESGSAGELSLPETVQGLIAARLDALPAKEKELVQDATVVGKVFWVGPLATIGDHSGHLVEERLHALERKEFVRRERHSTVAGETQYAFLHVLVRDVAYGQIPRAARAEKHRRAAEWIESLGRPEDHAEMLAHHHGSALEFATASGQPVAELAESARLAFREAGDHAAALFAPRNALRLYERALELWPLNDPERPLLLYRRVKAAHESEGAGEEAMDEARETLIVAGEPGLAAEVDAMRSLDLWVQGDRDGSLARLAEAAALVENEPPTRSKATVLAMRARYLMLAGRSEETLQTGAAAIEMAKTLGLDEHRANVLNTLGIAQVHLGRIEEGLGAMGESVSLAERVGSPEVVRAQGNLASVLSELGNLRRSAELHRQARKAAERFGAREPLGWMLAEEAVDFYWSGDWDGALERLESLIPRYEDEPYFMEVPCRVARGLIHLGRGDAAGARDDAERAVEFQSRSQATEPQLLYPAHAFAARAAAEAGDDKRAAELAESALASWRERSHTYLAGAWIPDLAVALVRIGAGGELETISRVARVQTRWLEAAEAYAQGEYQAAAEIYAEMGALPSEAEARLRAAAALVAGGRRAEADAELRRALAFWRSVGATRYIREGEPLRAASA